MLQVVHELSQNKTMSSADARQLVTALVLHQAVEMFKKREQKWDRYAVVDYAWARRVREAQKKFVVDFSKKTPEFRELVITKFKQFVEILEAITRFFEAVHEANVLSEKSKSWRNQRRAFLACADNDNDRWLIYLKRAREGEPEALAYLETLDEAQREWDPEWEPPALAEQEEWFRFAKKQRCS